MTYTITVSGDAAKVLSVSVTEPLELTEAQKVVEQYWLELGEEYAEGWYGGLTWHSPTRATGEYGLPPNGDVAGTAVFELVEVDGNG